MQDELYFVYYVFLERNTSLMCLINQVVVAMEQEGKIAQLLTINDFFTAPLNAGI